MADTEWDRSGWEAVQRKRYGVRLFPETEWMRHTKAGICKWCGKAVAKPAIYWHKECKASYFLHTRLEDQLPFLISRDGEKCAMVGCGVRPMKWSRGIETRLTFEDCRYFADTPENNAFKATLWHRPEGRWQDLTPEERETGACNDNIERVLALEVDHRIALWEVAHLPDDERRWYFGPGNLWLLCPPCHKAKTRREAAKRAFEKRMASAQLVLFDSFAGGAGINPS
jgi:hypothetical protein